MQVLAWVYIALFVGVIVAVALDVSTDSKYAPLLCVLLVMTGFVVSLGEIL